MGNQTTGVIDKVAWVCCRDGKICCAKSKGKDLYYIPGGKREPGESDLETLVREIAEELSVRIVPETAEPFGVFQAEAHDKPGGSVVQMICYTAEYEGELAPAAEIGELAWLDYADKSLVSAVSGLIFDRLHQTGMI